MTKISKKDKAAENDIMDVFSRCTAKNGMTEASVGAVITMELDIEVHKAIVENLLKGHMEAEYTGNPDKPYDAEKFVFRLTEDGTKSVTKIIKGMK
jgi:hypothetical protein